MKYFLIIAAGFLIGCGSESDLEPDFFIDQDLVSMYGNFQVEAYRFNREINDDLLIIKFVPETHHAFGKNMIGLTGKCIKGVREDEREIAGEPVHSVTARWREIWIIDRYRDHWGLEALFYHELGHCLLNRKHSDEYSLMNYDTLENLDEDTIDVDWPELETELFSNW